MQYTVYSWSIDPYKRVHLPITFIEYDNALRAALVAAKQNPDTIYYIAPVSSYDRVNVACIFIDGKIKILSA